LCKRVDAGLLRAMMVCGMKVEENVVKGMGLVVELDDEGGQ
jgi:hypothetical protein